MGGRRGTVKGEHVVGQSLPLPSLLATIMLLLCILCVCVSFATIGLCERGVIVHLGTPNSKQPESLTLPSFDNKNVHQNLDMETSGMKDV